VVRDAATGRVLHVEGALHLIGSVKKTSKKLTWVAKADDLVPCVLMEFDHLITKRVLVKGMDHKDYVNPVTKHESLALGEPAMRLLKTGDIIQLQRRGFFRVDSLKPFVCGISSSSSSRRPCTHSPIC
jgi:glutamyl-tRNA synthetase